MISLPSANILKLKELLKDGWKISSHKVSFTAVTNQEKVHIVLEKEGKKTFMEVTNDDEFTEYTLHFEKFQDRYGNDEFIYVEDLKGYRKKLEDLEKRGAVPNRPYKISIGETELKDAHLYHLCMPGPGGEHVGVANFFVPLDRNPALYQLDFRDEVKVEWTDNQQMAFRGYAHQVYSSERSAMLLCYGSTRRFFQSRVSCEFVGTKGEDALYFLAVSGGLKPQFHGIAQPLLTRRNFNVIFPVGGLDIPCDFNVEQVRFTKDIWKVFPERVKKAKTLSNAPWSTVSAFAFITVEAEHYFEALTKAEEIAKRAIDWIQFRTDITLPSVIENGKNIPLSYNLSKSFSKCFLIPYGLAIDTITNGAVFSLLTVQSGHELVFNYNPREFFEPLSSVWGKLEQMYKVDSDSVQPLYEALSWLMQTFEVESSIDNLLQLWVAMEFICSKERVPKFVRHMSINNTISSIKRLGLPQNEEEVIIRSIQQVNTPSLMVKWDYLLKRLRIRLTEKEQELLSRLRTERNNITHGKKVSKLAIEDIEKFRSILERVFLMKVTQLIDSLYAIPDLSQLFG
jgi:hypothetical protein